MAVILDGKKVAVAIRKEIKAETEVLRSKINRVPGVAVIMAGQDPASSIYVQSKNKMAKKLGFTSKLVQLSENAIKEELIKAVQDLNSDDTINGVIVQLPLPNGLDTWDILDNLAPQKDVDCFLPASQGSMLLGLTDILPCTPAGILKILDKYDIDVCSKNVVVVGRSFIVGKPIATLLTNRSATVTICHSKTDNIKEHLLRADIVVSAVGKPGFITDDMVKEGVVLIDVGTNYIDDESVARQLCLPGEFEKFSARGYAFSGDINPKAFKKSKAYTPVPGGVGATTVTMLMYNTLQLFKIHNKDKIG